MKIRTGFVSNSSSSSFVVDTIPEGTVLLPFDSEREKREREMDEYRGMVMSEMARREGIS